MKRGERFWEILTENADLAEESMPGRPIVEIAGDDRVFIENHLGVKGYSLEKIVVAVGYGELWVCGKCLRLQRMSKVKLVIRGRIEQVTLRRRD